MAKPETKCMWMCVERAFMVVRWWKSEGLRASSDDLWIRSSRFLMHTTEKLCSIIIIQLHDPVLIVRRIIIVDGFSNKLKLDHHFACANENPTSHVRMKISADSSASRWAIDRHTHIHILHQRNWHRIVINVLAVVLEISTEMNEHI